MARRTCYSNLKEGDKLFALRYTASNTPSVEEVEFAYYGGNNSCFECYCSTKTSLFDNRVVNAGYTFDVNVFSSKEEAQAVCDFLRNANDICNSCEFSDLMSENFCCRTCVHCDSDNCCNKVRELTENHLDVLKPCLDFPCIYYKPNKPYLQNLYPGFDRYKEIYIGCEYWFAEWNDVCPMKKYMSKNKPKFYKGCRFESKIIPRLSERTGEICLYNKAPKDKEFVGLWKYMNPDDIAEFKFVVDGKITFDTEVLNIYNKRKATTFNTVEITM